MAMNADIVSVQEYRKDAMPHLIDVKKLSSKYIFN